MDELKETQAMLVHAEKMRSLGELVAGITHEINNPVNFIYGNLTHLDNYSQDLMAIIDKYKEYNDNENDIEALTKRALAEFNTIAQKYGRPGFPIRTLTSFDL